MAIEIRTAKESDLNSLYRFRYRIYVEEMQRIQTDADHEKRIIVDSFDETAVNVIALDDGQIVGAQRINLGCDTDFGAYATYYQMKRFGAYFPNQASVSTRLMVQPSYRKTLVPLKLALRCFSIGISNGSCFDFMDCNSHLVGYFSKLGFRQAVPNFQHDEYGEVVPMVLVGHDIDHFAQVGSPFLKHRDLCSRDHPSIDYFYKNIYQLSASSRS